MQSATKISLVTLVVAVAALVLALWPVVADAPWELKRTAEERRLQEMCDEMKRTQKLPAWQGVSDADKTAWLSVRVQGCGQ